MTYLYSAFLRPKQPRRCYRMARVSGITRWHHPNEAPHIRYSLLLNLSTSEGWKAQLA